MSITLLQKFLPENTLPYLQKWFGTHRIHFKITKDRASKLGDYRKLSAKSHQITLNSTLPKQLFFFVLTHEMAHLIAFEKFGNRIPAHGSGWKTTFRDMLLESISVYESDLRPIILNFAKSPKANFMASPELVRYFHIQDEGDERIFVEELSYGSHFVYRSERYLLETKSKKNYICSNLNTGKKYVFRPLARVYKTDENGKIQ